MVELFGVATSDIDDEFRTNGTKVPLAKQIATMVRLFGKGISSGSHRFFPKIRAELAADAGRLMGLVFGAIADFCFNMEYVRRITDARWAYCTKADDQRVYYPYLGVCPHCVLKGERPISAVLGVSAAASEEEKESRARYFGNKGYQARSNENLRLASRR